LMNIVELAVNALLHVTSERIEDDTSPSLLKASANAFNLSSSEGAFARSGNWKI